MQHPRQVSTVFESDDQVTDDFSKTFHKVRSTLADSRGRSYLEFSRSLKPDYKRVIRDIVLGYVMLVASVATSWFLLGIGVFWLVVVVLGSLFIGYWIAYIQLFIHEGAHFNLAADRSRSDRLCNLLIAWLIGTSVESYRVVHFQHHRALGTTNDSEFTYFFPLNFVFLSKALLGIRALEVLIARRKYLAVVEANAGSASTGRGASARNGRSTASDRPKAMTDKFPIASAIAHLMIVGVCWSLGSIPLAFAWVLGVGIVFPFCGALRQLLEHRSDTANGATDYRRTDHGAFTRIFGNDPFSATFGGAGFNRHLLHHWEPQLSYTNLQALEAFLTDTPMRSIMATRRSSYAGTFLKLLSLR
jgi:fatty acid desaturase